MTNDENNDSRADKLAILSACGSVASLTALVVVLIDRGSDDPQLAVWSITLALVCLLIVGAIAVFEFDYLRAIYVDSSRSLRSKAVKTVISLIPALMLAAIFLDGLFAAIRWTWWMGGFKPVLKYIF